MIDSVPPEQPRLPDWMRGLALVDFVVVAGVGGFGLFILAAFMPYGHPIPSAAAVYVRFGLTFLIVPITLTAGTLAAGRGLYLRGSHRVGAALFFLPLLGVPWLLTQMAL